MSLLSAYEAALLRNQSKKMPKTDKPWFEDRSTGDAIHFVEDAPTRLLGSRARHLVVTDEELNQREKANELNRKL